MTQTRQVEPSGEKDARDRPSSWTGRAITPMRPTEPTGSGSGSHRKEDAETQNSALEPKMLKYK